MESTHPMYELDRDYVAKIKQLQRIRLAIVGKDPYPRGACGIPFVKDTWHDLQGNSAGFCVFRSAFGQDPRKGLGSPRDAAFLFLEGGVVLLNASYYFLGEKAPIESLHRTYVADSYKVNGPILDDSELVRLCGAASKMISWVVGTMPLSFKRVPHPSMQSRNRLRNERKGEWDEWWASGRLGEWLKKSQ